MAEGDGLLNRYRGKLLSWVRIPSSPPAPFLPASMIFNVSRDHIFAVGRGMGDGGCGMAPPGPDQCHIADKLYAMRRRAPSCCFKTPIISLSINLCFIHVLPIGTDENTSSFCGSRCAAGSRGVNLAATHFAY